VEISVVILDDFPAMRAGLALLLRKLVPSIVILAEMSAASSAVNVIQKLKPAIVVMELGAHGRSGLEIIECVRRNAPKTRVLVFTVQKEEDFGVRCLKAGASGFVCKNSPVEELAKAITEVASGGKYLTAALKSELLEEWTPTRSLRAHERLSPREFEIMTMIADGQALKLISAELDLSQKTVSTYRARILEKMGAKTNADLTKYLLRACLPPRNAGDVRVFGGGGPPPPTVSLSSPSPSNWEG